MGYTEIDGRIDGERRKYTKGHSAAATSAGPHTYIPIPLRCCVHLAYISAPIEIKISRPCKYLNAVHVTANACNQYFYFTMLYMYMYYFLKYCHGRAHGYGDNIVKHTSLFSRYLYCGNITTRPFLNQYVIGKHIINVQSRSDLILS